MLGTGFDDPNMMLLQKEVDPYFYKERLTMPKLVVNAVGDELQQPDDNHYWWNDMPGAKHLLTAPGAKHSEKSAALELVPAIYTWISYHIKGYTVPAFTWDISSEDGSITAVLDGEGDVFEASVWWSHSCCKNVDEDGTITQK